MEAKLLNEVGEQTYALIFKSGDEVMSTLTQFAKDHSLTASHFTAIGAFRDVTLGYFDWATKDYKKIPVNEQVEVLSLVGDIALQDRGEPKIHAHVVVGTADGTARGGHLLEAHVRPTLELILTETPNYLRRKYDQQTGLALIEIAA